ncbi:MULTISPECIES: hypothetical protein [unclassified Psychrobacter]|uniref:hypothetical protein n=1 Tax=unclassified Psychrobacter TaxID=196806 RepID=UPI0025B345A0|nr:MULTISPECIES: hypothetical protein [unclassified Psychrobacter]MDN3453145.1 hypothetical protein [Psychrobacter sp. APC 3350]MDN3501628.1 hypothetical protein [Psychrobacter sp. 5A.1]
MSLLPKALTVPITSALSRWFASRAPKSDRATLNLRNVYIFFSREGLLFAVLLIITFIAGINYGNNLVLGLCFYLISIWLISFHVTFAHISGLKVRLLEVSMTEAGAPVWVTLQLNSDSRQPRRQLLFEFEPLATQNKKHGTNAPHSVLITRLQGEQVIRLPIQTNIRGELELPRLKIKTVYPLGIMRAWSYIYFTRTAWVYPKPEAFDWQAQYAIASLEDLPTGGQHRQGQDDFERLDNYIEGESLARVSWGHVARGQGMLTKHFADPVGHEQTLDYADMPAAHHEQKLAQLAYGALTLGQLSVPFQMRLPNDTPATAVMGDGETFAQACLLRLAKAP